MSTVVLGIARLPVLPLKHVRVVVRTLQVSWLRQTAPRQPYRMALPLRARVTPIVSTVLPSPFTQAAALLRQHCLVHRRATADLFRWAFPAMPPTSVCVTFPRLTLWLAQNAWPLEVIMVRFMHPGSME